MGHHSPASIFFLQMAVILLACRLVGMVAKRFGQPQVVAEMITGVLLGPSLFGYFWPDAQQFLFPKESLNTLYVISQIGVGFYMFLVGLQFRTDHFAGRAKSAAAVSISGIAVPFTLGALLAVWFVKTPGLFSEKASASEAALFMGAAMSITAFPMLARIIKERGLSHLPLGTLALAAGAIDDAAAWCILAVVLASFGGATAGAVFTIGGGIGYALFALFALRPLLKNLTKTCSADGEISNLGLGIVMMLFCAAAWFTDFIGIHTVFGGFLLGIAMPRGVFSDSLNKLVEPFTTVFLLPTFFTYSGLKTRLDLLGSTQLLFVSACVLLAACLGKGAACWAAARMTGEDNRTALGVGTLMNARGLMELIILNIGLQHGLILAPLFSVMVLMAVLTTLMATPLFEWLYGRRTAPAPPGTLPSPG